MAAVEHKGDAMLGQFMHPVINQDTQNSDPWQRNYFQPPPLKPLVPRTYPLTDLRPEISRPEYSPLDLLKSHGFGIVKHRSAFVDTLDTDLSEDAIAEVYHPEVQALVKKVTGAKHTFIVASTFRQGKRAPTAFNFPTGYKPISEAIKDDSKNGDQQPKAAEQTPQQHKLAKQTKLALAAPIRVPHMDFTPLGARQTIRFQSREIRDIAEKTGVIALEDEICKAGSTDAALKESDATVAEQYNCNGKLGPRYAAYSIWRPLKKVGRDPLALASRREIAHVGGEKVHWNYNNKIPGPADLKGDYLREYAMLGVAGMEPPTENEQVLKWYYLSDQTEDEVLFVKLFDSAALGPEAEHASAPWHGSPEIGEAAVGDEPRESIDIRVLAFF